MSDLSDEVLRLRRQLDESKAREQETAAREQETAAREQETAARLQETAARLQAERRKNQMTTLEEYLHNCHFNLYQKLRIADKSKLTTGYTKVDNRYYPKFLRPWIDFPSTRQHHFEATKTACEQRRLFHPEISTTDMGTTIDHEEAGNENAVDYFETLAVEHPVRRILRHLWEEEEMRKEYQCKQLRFCKNLRDFTQLSNADLAPEEDLSDRRPEQPCQTGPNKRVATEKRVKPLTKPDGAGVRMHLGGGESLAFVFDYKAAHKVPLEYLKPAIARETLFMEVIERLNSDTNTTDTKLWEQEKAEELIAMALTQVFDYMVRYGVKYGYIAAGKSLLLLFVDFADLQTLYCHPCVPDEDVGAWTDDKASYTAVAQLASFCLLSLQSEALKGSQHEVLWGRAKTTLKTWKNLYDDETQDADSPSTSSQPSTSASQQTQGSEYVPEDEMSESALTRQYCTQACLLGLKRGQNLDDSCPNVLSHSTAEGSSRHAIDADNFTRLVGEQLRQNPYRNCEALDGWGKSGATGVLFKLELAPYGYTFVGKGSLPGCNELLAHESFIYARLEKLQGEVVPVHLGLVQLDWGYILPGAVRVHHMMLMSWGGETVNRETKGPVATNLPAEVQRSSRDIWAEGVNHGDERDANRLWNDERHRVMIIDFDHAALVRLKNKHLSKVLPGKKKRERSRSRTSPGATTGHNGIPIER
ncbi:hypothetical protein N0V84_010089 [Fusarium piperis]|uniref:Uncharacterized protein n=1 Tax=Fusarium piperis TaxID=1435070 RepID=A0A9W9BH13_9HYPO|nr:hypothetical protein N0V84_010089 [Fusarium piperis]